MVEWVLWVGNLGYFRFVLFADRLIVWRLRFASWVVWDLMSFVVSGVACFLCLLIVIL